MRASVRRIGLVLVLVGLAAAFLAPVATGRPMTSTHRKESRLLASGSRFNWRGLRGIFETNVKPPTTAQCKQRSHLACYSPAQFQRAYDLESVYGGGIDGSGETIALVDAFGSPTIKDDLKHFDAGFGLPAPPSFKIIHPAGKPPHFFPSPSRAQVGWAEETTLDVEYAHAFTPGAKILLVETPINETESTQGFGSIVKAENYVVNHGMADVISQSFGATEETFPSHGSIKRLRSAYKNAAAHNVTVLASSGDSGATGYTRGNTFYPHRVVSWPASDPLVTAVGGTQLHLDSQGDRTSVDSAWNETYNKAVQSPYRPPYPTATGGGRSTVFARPSYEDNVQSDVGSKRGMPDVSMSAAVNGGALVYCCDFFKTRYRGFFIYGGTSESAPEFAGIVALVDQQVGHSIGFINPVLYDPSTLGIVDVHRGDNDAAFRTGKKKKVIHVRGFKAGTGYDLATGVGTIDGAAFVAGYPPCLRTVEAVTPRC